jgi:hypothetical protein
LGATIINKTNIISDDATFRACGSAIAAALEAVGCIKTADTGQIDWATVARPLVNTMAGYEIRQLPAGTLQTANPILLKIGYGCGYSLSGIGFTFQIGHTTDGAGAFTGAYSSLYTIGSYVAGVPTNYFINSFSCDEEHLSMSLFMGPQSTSKYNVLLGIDRLRDVDGVALDTGCNIVISGYNSLFYQFMLPSGAGAQFPATALLQPMTIAPPVGAPSNYGLNYYNSFLYPYLGYCGNPDLNFIAYGTDADVSPGGTSRIITIYSVEHTYLLIATTMTAGPSSSTNWSLGVRYE